MAAIWCSECVLCTADQKASCFPAAAGSHQSQSITLLLTRPFQQVGCKSWAGSSLHPQAQPLLLAAAKLTSTQGESIHSTPQAPLAALCFCFPALFTEDKQPCSGPSGPGPFGRLTRGAGDHPQAVMHSMPWLGSSKQSFGFPGQLLVGGTRASGPKEAEFQVL